MAARVPEGVRLSRPGPSTAWWVALVGRTILRTQVAQFGASLRDLPPGPSTAEPRPTEQGLGYPTAGNARGVVGVPDGSRSRGLRTTRWSLPVHRRRS